MQGKRIVFRVLPLPDGDWEITRDGKRVRTRGHKRQAVDVGRRLARKAHHVDGELTQLVVHGVNGRIQTEHTYGQDPRRHRG